ncbi:MAG: sugar phosphate nucleotidyltransferase [Promethearchaeota archaeon]
MKAIILCAGYGKRLKSYTKRYQKSMLPLHGKPLLDYIINGLITSGFKEFILVVGYKKEQIFDYFQEGKRWDISIEYIEQKELNGTGGALLLCEQIIDESHFFLTWGDILVPYKVYKDVYNIFLNENQNFILVVNHSHDPYLGAAVICDNLYCKTIIEKPPKGSGYNYNNSGIFIFSKEIFSVLKILKPSKRGEIEITDAIRMGIKERNWKVRVFKMEKGQFRGDFGNIEMYRRLKKDTSWLKELKELNRSDSK